MFVCGLEELEDEAENRANLKGGGTSSALWRQWRLVFAYVAAPVVLGSRRGPACVVARSGLGTCDGRDGRPADRLWPRWVA